MQHRTARNVLSAFMAFVMVFTCNSATFQPLVAMAGDVPEREVVQEPLADGGSQGAALPEGQSAVVDSEDVASGEAQGEDTPEPNAQPPVDEDATAGEDADDAPDAQALTSSLEVFVAFDPVEATSKSVTLQLQRQMRAWDEGFQQWGAWSQEWEAAGEPFELTCEALQA